MKKISYIIITLLYSIILVKIIDIRFINVNKYNDEYTLKSNNIISGKTPLRGRILDRNNNVLVDNISIYNINYRKIKNVSMEEEYEIAKKLTYFLDLNEIASEMELKDYYVLNNDISIFLTEQEKEDYKYRKLSQDDINNLLLERIDDEIKKYSEEEKVIIHTYYLMNKGYLSDTKLIKENIDYNLCARISEENIKGISCDITWKRVVNYHFLETIVGNVGKISEENKEKYLNEGYTSEDIVGTSGLELYYDEFLKGKKAKYKLNDDNSLTLLQEEEKGADLILSLDLELEKKSYELLKNHFEIADSLANTNYFKEAYIIISNPNNGQILSLVGLQKNKINKVNSYSDISSKALISSYTVGSIVKGASHTVGYLNNLIDVGKKINDSCVKLYNVPEKCSFKRLGMIDDISALKMSSNYYQFIIAIKSTGNKYYNNMKLEVNEDNFNLYRDVFKKYGLGSSTKIDFDKESTGIKGEKISGDLLLNLAIGQYDTYTPIELTAYINTIATKGKRYALSFKLKDNEIVDEVNLEEKYMDRIIKGFYEVVNNGTGRGYTDVKYKPVGKTGTSESYYDKNIMTINSSYIMFAPIDNPKYSVVVVTPNVSYQNEKHEYIAFINRMISKSITDFLFENY